MGLGFILGLTILSAIREIAGNATLMGYSVGHFQAMLVMILPPGGFLVLGCLLGLMNHIQNAISRRRGTSFTPPPTLDCRHCIMLCNFNDAKTH